MKRALIPLLILIALVPIREIDACTPNYYSYLFYGGRDLLQMPTAMFDVECGRILGLTEPPEFESQHRGSFTSSHEETVADDLNEFGMAVADLPNANALVEEYTALRNALTAHVKPWMQTVDRELTYYGSLRRVAANLERVEPFDLAPYDGLLSRVPAEFARYLRGAVAYHAGDWDSAVAHFASVLELPADARPYRSTWAAYMLGKSWLNTDPAKAAPFFEQCRTFAEEGFADSLDLAAESSGWQAHAEMASAQYTAAIHRYAASKNDAGLNLRVVCGRALSAETVDRALVDDALSRRIVTAWVVAHPQSTKMTEKWLNALDAYHPDGIVDDADHLAWLNYQQGDMEQAARWLDHCAPDAPYGLWVRAKLLLRDGELEEGAALLDHLGQTIPIGENWSVQPQADGYIWNPASAREVVQEELGFAQLKNGKYEASLRAFLEAENRADAIFVAERVLTCEELAAFIDSLVDDPLVYSDDSDAYGSWRRPDLQDLLARRWGREGHWDRAAEVFSGELSELAREMHEHSVASQDESLPPRIRADHLMAMGRIIRERGPELYCPELMPGQGERFEDATGVPPDLAERIAANQRFYPKMNYFKPFAADYMWQAAKLLPDNDPMTAHALYLGGTFLKKRDPEAADRFYKALVRRNPNLLIARQADTLRWFPKEFTDVVLYQPIPEAHWYDRKRNLALAGLAVGAAVALLFAVVRGAAKARSGEGAA